jgi:hypothetical protein
MQQKRSIDPVNVVTQYSVMGDGNGVGGQWQVRCNDVY